MRQCWDRAWEQDFAPAEIADVDLEEFVLRAPRRPRRKRHGPRA